MYFIVVQWSEEISRFLWKAETQTYRKDKENAIPSNSLIKKCYFLPNTKMYWGRLHQLEGKELQLLQKYHYPLGVNAEVKMTARSETSGHICNRATSSASCGASSWPPGKEASTIWKEITIMAKPEPEHSFLKHPCGHQHQKGITWLNAAQHVAAYSEVTIRKQSTKRKAVRHTWFPRASQHFLQL